jgi:hypothetical protein
MLKSVLADIAVTGDALAAQIHAAAECASEALTQRDAELEGLQRRVAELTSACEVADGVVTSLTRQLLSSRHERASTAARAAVLRVEFERELRSIEVDAALYVR